MMSSKRKTYKSRLSDWLQGEGRTVVTPAPGYTEYRFGKTLIVVVDLGGFNLVSQEK